MVNSDVLYLNNKEIEELQSLNVIRANNPLLERLLSSYNSIVTDRLWYEELYKIKSLMLKQVEEDNFKINKELEHTRKLNEKLNSHDLELTKVINMFMSQLQYNELVGLEQDGSISVNSPDLI